VPSGVENAMLPDLIRDRDAIVLDALSSEIARASLPIRLAEGLSGVFKTTARVLSVKAAASSAGSTRQSGGRRRTKRAVAPARRSIGR